MRRSVQSHLVPILLEDLRPDRGKGALSVRTSHMESRIGVLRISDLPKEVYGPIQSPGHTGGEGREDTAEGDVTAPLEFPFLSHEG